MQCYPRRTSESSLDAQAVAVQTVPPARLIQCSFLAPRQGIEYEDQTDGNPDRNYRHTNGPPARPVIVFAPEAGHWLGIISDVPPGGNGHTGATSCVQRIQTSMPFITERHKILELVKICTRCVFVSMNNIP